MDNSQEHIYGILKILPDSPGVYQFFNSTGVIIYVGKAKSLKKRVKSYFVNQASHTGKLKVLVKKIVDIKYIVVETEYEALLLENNLIKKYLPRYNVLLKDDKTYPWICVKNENFPRVFSTRTIIKDGSHYFGPYASGKMMHTLLDLVYQLFQIRTCFHNLSQENIEKKKFKVCLKYHIGNCKGPCEGLQSKEDYDLSMMHIREIIKGNIFSVQEQLKKEMAGYAAKLEFEKAQMLKEKIETLQHYQSKSTVVSRNIRNVDVFTLLDDTTEAYVNFLKVVDGAIIQAHTIEFKKQLNESPEELMSIALLDIRERLFSNAEEILVSVMPDIKIPGVKITVPQIGEKKKLLDLSLNNAKYYRIEREKQKELVDPDRHVKRIMEQAQKDLRLPELPDYIECIDNSNIQGDFAVSALVVFKNGRPDKSEYRHFNIKTVEGPNDFASMEEVVSRRYKKLIEENKELPKLLIIDGGKGQLSSAVSSLTKLGLKNKIPIIGIAKRLEEIYFPGDSIPLYLDKKSETLKLIQQLRDEAHRFGITHHRQKRQKETIKTNLTEIEGIGYNTAQKLLRKFKSVEKIRKTPGKELAQVIGKQKAQLLIQFFNNETKNSKEPKS